MSPVSRPKTFVTDGNGRRYTVIFGIARPIRDTERQWEKFRQPSFWQLLKELFT